MKDVTTRNLITDEIITEFINRRFPGDCNWTTGNCYYFATILCTRFPNLKIYYMPITGHFVVSSDKVNFYDHTGRVNVQEEVYDFELLKDEDPIWYNRLIRDCIM